MVGLKAATQESGAVRFFWSPSFSPFAVTYLVEVEDLDSGMFLSSEIMNTTSFLYSPQNGFCSVLVFRIHASNLVGLASEANLTYNMFTSK